MQRRKLPSHNVATARVSQSNLPRHYLRALQHFADGEKEPQSVPNDGGEITLEHILPETLTEEWKIKADDHKALANRLGNLAFASSNAELRFGKLELLGEEESHRGIGLLSHQRSCHTRQMGSRRDHGPTATPRGTSHQDLASQARLGR